MVFNEENQNYEQIDLKGAISILLKRKVPIIAVSFAAALAAVICILMAPDYHNVRTAIEIGNLAAPCSDSDQRRASFPVESPAQVKEKIINDMYEFPDRKIFDMPDNFPLQAVNVYGTDIIYITVKTADPDSGRKYLEAVNSKIIEQHQNLYFDPVSGRNEAAIGSDQKNNAILRMTKVIKMPFDAGRTRPNIWLYGSMAGFFGLIAGVIAVSLIDWWRQPQAKQREPRF